MDLPVESCNGGICSQLACWPVIIYVVFAIIVLIGIVCSSKIDPNVKAWSFFMVLIWSLIWTFILWFFCKNGQHAIAWFLLLLPLAFAVLWFISVFLATATTNSQCVARGVMAD